MPEGLGMHKTQQKQALLGSIHHKHAQKMQQLTKVTIAIKDATESGMSRQITIGSATETNPNPKSLPKKLRINLSI